MGSGLDFDLRVARRRFSTGRCAFPGRGVSGHQGSGGGDPVSRLCTGQVTPVYAEDQISRAQTDYSVLSRRANPKHV